MAISKKGTRVITVDDVEYLYKVSKVKKKSDWRKDENKLNDEFLKHAKKYGLGNLKDITINIVAQLKNSPTSNLYVKINTVLVDSFMGAEQVTQIKPQFVAKLIQDAIFDGWKPTDRKDYRLTISDTDIKTKQPIILNLSGEIDDAKKYKNVDYAKKIDLKKK